METARKSWLGCSKMERGKARRRTRGGGRNERKERRKRNAGERGGGGGVKGCFYSKMAG